MARAIASREPLRGRWLDGTSYAKALFVDKLRGRRTDRAQFESDVEVRLDQLPALRDNTPEQYRSVLMDIMEEIHGAEQSDEKSVVGAKRLASTPIDRRSEVAPTPWLHRKHLMVAWADHSDPICIDYVGRFYDYQQCFRAAVHRLRATAKTILAEQSLHWPAGLPQALSA